MPSAISVTKLQKSFPTGLSGKLRKVLHEVSFQVPEGVATGFVGANGSGKTTSLKCILGFLRKDGGSVEFGGQPLSDEVRRHLGYLPERPYLYEFLTAREFLRLHWDLSGARGNFVEEMQRVLKRVDLPGVEDRLLRGFSKGMLQRSGLAQALLHRPKLLILDEPMSGLDPDGRWLVKEVIREEIKSGVTVFLSSHLLSDLQELCEHLVVVDGGEILFDGATKEFLQVAGTPERPGLEEAFIRAQRKHRLSRGQSDGGPNS